jgi:GT2 family glycosyltransferase
VPAEPLVTVAVVVKDRRELMRACLAGIERLRAPGPHEVVLVDNGSTDGTLELLHEHATAATVPTQVLSVGGTVGAARNGALQAARAPLIAFTDSDCVPQPDWLDRIVAAMTPDVAVAQGRTVPAGPSERRWAVSQDIDRFTDLYEACNICYRVADLRAAGGFDEAIGFFGEDTAAGWRLRRAGGRGVFAPEAVVAHAVHDVGPAWHLRRAYGYRNWPALVRRFPEMRDEILFARWFLRPRSVVVWAALTGLALAAGGRRSGVALAVPWLWRHRPQRPGVAGALDSAAGLTFDAAVAAGLTVGSIRERTPVL